VTKLQIPQVRPIFEYGNITGFTPTT